MSMTLIQYASQIHPGNGAARGVALQLNKSSVMMPRLRVQKMNGLVHKFARLEKDGAIARRSFNMPFPATERSVTVPDQERFEIAGAKVTTDHRMVSAGPEVHATEIARRTRALGRYIDKQLLHGAGKTDQTQIIGLRDRITESSQVITAAANGAVLTLAMFEDLIDAVEDLGAGRVVFAPKKLVRKFKQVLVAQAAGATVAEAASEVMTYEGVTIIPMGKDEAGEEILDFNETQGSSNVTASIYCIAPGAMDDDGTNILMASNSIEVLNEGLRDSAQNDVIEVAFGLSVFVHKSAARLKGLKAG